jgi:hypothetical protein
MALATRFNFYSIPPTTLTISRQYNVHAPWSGRVEVQSAHDGDQRHEPRPYGPGKLAGTGITGHQSPAEGTRRQL